MWTIVLVLLGVALVCAVAGFHIGPHAHALAGVFGLVASIWLVLMAIDGHSTPLLWSVLGGDLVVAGGLGTLAWKGLTTSSRQASHRDSRMLEGLSGTAVTELRPDGVVRVNGETWSATSRNGNFPSGAQVQVILASGVRLEVWGEDDNSLDPDVFAQADLTLGGDASIQRKEGS
jgi:membrane-bound ClpP family serine protease